MTTATHKASSKKTNHTSSYRNSYHSTSNKKSSNSSPDVTTLLRADHNVVTALFAEYESTRSTAKKKQLVEKICTELTVHAQVEEEIFYPAIKPVLKDKELVPEALVEHASLKSLIAQVEDMEPDGEMFDAKIKVLSEYVKHHVKEEQSEIFPKVKASKLDTVELGRQVAERKEQILMEYKQGNNHGGSMSSRQEDDWI